MDELIRMVEERLESCKMRTLSEVEVGFESERRRILAMVEEGFNSEKVRNRARVEKEFESTKRSMVTEIKRYFEDANPISSPTNMKLEFRNKIAQQILTGEEIKGELGLPIEVALVDDSTGDVIIAGPESSANIEIVPLKGKCEVDEGFNSNIVPEVVGKQPILAGKVALQLHKGLGVVKNIKFRHHAIKIKPSEFMLGARVVGNYRIKEAKTEPFVLKDFRIKYKAKRRNPLLGDEVSKLVNICRGGEIERRLRASKISTVEDFLIQLLINPQGLKSIVKSPAKNWEATVTNARACLIGERVYFYMDQHQKTGIAFNILGRVVGQHPTNALSEKEKADLLASAYANWEEVRAFDDQTLLEQHLASLTACTVGESSPNANFSGENGGQDFGSFLAGIDNIDIPFDYTAYRSWGEVEAESISANLTTRENGGEEFGFFGSNGVEIVYHSAIQFAHAFPCSLILDDSAAEPGVGSGRRKRWRKLFCILTWVIRKERGCVDVNPRQKKRRVD